MLEARQVIVILAESLLRRWVGYGLLGMGNGPWWDFWSVKRDKSLKRAGRKKFKNFSAMVR